MAAVSLPAAERANAQVFKAAASMPHSSLRWIKFQCAGRPGKNARGAVVCRRSPVGKSKLRCATVCRVRSSVGLVARHAWPLAPAETADQVPIKSSSSLFQQHDGMFWSAAALGSTSTHCARPNTRTGRLRASLQCRSCSTLTVRIKGSILHAGGADGPLPLLARPHDARQRTPQDVQNADKRPMRAARRRLPRKTGLTLPASCLLAGKATTVA